MKFGDIISFIRIDILGIIMGEFSRKTYIPLTTIIIWELGRVEPLPWQQYIIVNYIKDKFNLDNLDYKGDEKLRYNYLIKWLENLKKDINIIL